MRTIIDILKKGNQELFHSDMLAWMMNPEAEHGMGNYMLRSIADLLADRGDRTLVDLLAQGLPTIQTEVSKSKHRYDIVVCVGKITVIFENKTKSVGADLQLGAYEGDDSPHPLGVMRRIF